MSTVPSNLQSFEMVDQAIIKKELMILLEAAKFQHEEAITQSIRQLINSFNTIDV